MDRVKEMVLKEIQRTEGRIADFADALGDDPVDAFSRSDSVIEDAAILSVLRHAAQLIDSGTSPQRIYDLLVDDGERVLLSGSWLSRSTSTMHNVVEDARRGAAAQVMGEANRFSGPIGELIAELKAAAAE